MIKECKCKLVNPSSPCFLFTAIRKNATGSYSQRTNKHMIGPATKCSKMQVLLTRQLPHAGQEGKGLEGGCSGTAAFNLRVRKRSISTCVKQMHGTCSAHASALRRRASTGDPPLTCSLCRFVCAAMALSSSSGVEPRTSTKKSSASLRLCSPVREAPSLRLHTLHIMEGKFCGCTAGRRVDQLKCRRRHLRWSAVRRGSD